MADRPREYAELLASVELFAGLDRVALAIAATRSRRLRLANTGGLATGRGASAASTAESHAASRPTPSVASRTTRPVRMAIGLGLAGTILLGMWLTPPPAGLTVNGW